VQFNRGIKTWMWCYCPSCHTPVWERTRHRACTGHSWSEMWNAAPLHNRDRSVHNQSEAISAFEEKFIFFLQISWYIWIGKLKK